MNECTELTAAARPSMTPEQVTWVSETFHLIRPRADIFAMIFYERLFTLDPAVRPMFKTDIEQQSRKLMAMLSAVIAMIEKPMVWVPVAEQLGRRHVAYGVVDAHYDTVGAALLEALGRVLGDKFTDEVKGAWLALFMAVASTMKAAAAGAR